MAIAELELALADKPFDVDLRQVYADALEDSDIDGSNQRAIAEAIKDWQNRCCTHSDRQEVCFSWTLIQAKLKETNGNRRIRLLAESDVEYCVKYAIVSGWCAKGGGTVANAYGNRSYQTVCVAALRTDGNVRVEFAVTSGSKGSSIVRPVCGLLKNAPLAAFRKWADNVGGYNCGNEVGKGSLSG